ncbi:hypothetical protein D3C73_1283520 [compost metagenome]
MRTMSSFTWAGGLYLAHRLFTSSSSDISTSEQTTVVGKPQSIASRITELYTWAVVNASMRKLVTIRYTCDGSAALPIFCTLRRR